jgi:hypothetical protein
MLTSAALHARGGAVPVSPLELNARRAKSGVTDHRSAISSAPSLLPRVPGEMSTAAAQRIARASFRRSRRARPNSRRSRAAGRSVAWCPTSSASAHVSSGLRSSIAADRSIAAPQRPGPHSARPSGLTFTLRRGNMCSRAHAPRARTREGPAPCPAASFRATRPCRPLRPRPSPPAR